MSLSEYQKKRDFRRTAEPSGRSPKKARAGALHFVVQKHAASHLHYDLRLEMEGVMRSWAVPKGPSTDPSVRRLAMEVEDHPIDYNDFEGTIPEREYGGGTVMLWDRGTYTPDERTGRETAERAALRGYRKGKLSMTFEGERMKGSYSLVRTEGVEGGPRSKWLLLKHQDGDAEPDRDITEEVTTSVVSGRTMEEIAAGEGGKRVWHSNRAQPTLDGRRKGSKAGENAKFKSLLPMLARSADRAPTNEDWIFEPKYDGIRVLAFATAGSVALVTRNGHDKARQFPEIVAALRDLVEDVGDSIVLDGEIVALKDGEIVRFEALQSRMHVTESSRARRHSESDPAALVAFDLLLAGDEPFINEAWVDRRSRLAELLEGRTSETLRLSEVSGDSEPLLKRGEHEGWEGLIAKRKQARYRPGQRTSDWVKLKLDNRQEFVVGGWTEPRKTRNYVGAILLGYYDEDGKLVYAGHTGTGFSGALLEEMHRRVKRLERKTPPFSERPKTNERAHWTTPKVVVEVKFNEWTRDGKLRQPVFLGIREDKDPREVVREPSAAGAAAIRAKASAKKPVPTDASSGEPASEALDTPVTRAIRKIGEGKGEGPLTVRGEGRIPITSLGKIFYPETGHTKQDLLIYYARMAKHILPWMADRPLVLKRYPNGVEGESFYQQAAPDTVPEGVRVETLEIEGKKQRRLVGGDLTTLLYTVQLGAISFDPWHSRISSLETPDYTVLDLDPGPDVDFQGVVEIARYVKEELDDLGMHGALKTSGSSGLHIYLPLPPSTPLDAATLVAQIIATRVANKHPRVATVERLTKKRPRGTIYVDYLQNILGKTVAGVYAARAKRRPTVSTPLKWEELTDELDLQEHTIDSVPARVARVGDLWKAPMSRPNSLKALLRRKARD